MQANNRKTLKRTNIIQLLIGVAAIILINIIAKFAFFRLDLTQEKRYTLSEPTKKMLKNLDDVVYYKIYLEGDFPAGFKRLRDETKEMLDEFRAIGGDNIQYEFINPSENSDKKERNKFYQQLAQKGLQPTNLNYKENDESAQKIIFPGAIVTYKGREIPVQLLKSQIGGHPEMMLNNSIKDLEYELSNSIRKLFTGSKPKIAFINGQRELEGMALADIGKSLREFYLVDSVSINGKLDALNAYKAIVIAKPDSLFNEKDKYIIDQYIMNGGNVLWLVESTFATMDSLSKSGETVGISSSVNLEDQLFKYGVRINTQFVQDIQGAPIPIVTGYVGNQPQTQLYPWYFFPLIFPVDKHPIVQNLNAIKFEFANCIDTIAVPGIKKTILLRTSKFARTLNTPTRINLNTVKEEPQESQFNRSYVPLAVLLEGKFESLYKNRLPAQLAGNKEFAFKDRGVKESRMIVVADGDVIRNQYSKAKGMVYPLGYDKYTGQEYGNKDFILNAINYLTDDEGLISVRAREVQLRLLDKKRIDKEKDKWRMVNTVLPIGLISIFGALQFYYRKRKYASA